jgi:excisionase family DNA binding protein
MEFLSPESTLRPINGGILMVINYKNYKSNFKMITPDNSNSSNELIKLLNELIQLLKIQKQLMSFIETDPYMTVASAAKLICISKVSLYKLIKKGFIPFYRLGEGAIKVKRSEVLSAYKLIKPRY